MSTLHTVNKSPFETRSLTSALKHAKDGDGVIMIEDGVFGGLGGTELADTIAAAGKSVSLYVLTPDLTARGVEESRLLDGVKGVDYTGFVELVAKYDRTQSWL